ncbi:UNVERIFIED_CONTAM: hypothetical protein FKN15_059476 [Acipenser sinensis]
MTYSPTLGVHFCHCCLCFLFSEGNELQEKYKRSTLDVAVLKEHLALRRDVARQAQACSHSLKSRLAVLEQELDEEREDKKDINADLTRQYKSMQMETGVRVHQLEIEVSRLHQQLDLQGEREERQRTVQEKDATIAELQGKIDNMETDYERILHGINNLELLIINSVNELYTTESVRKKKKLILSALRRDVARQAQACSHSLKSRLAVLEQELDEEREDKKDINADLTRQYKSMQMETGVRVHQLEIEVSRLRQQLALCQQDLQGEREERQRTVQEKDATIAELQGKIDNMETDYERILHCKPVPAKNGAFW